MFSLSGYPSELIITILCQCDLPSVFAVRQTSRNMYSLTHDRVIWLTLLNNICSSLDIPMAQFDLDVMTSIQLEELATSSKKLSASIRNSSGPGSEPLAPLRWEQVPAPAAGPWKATAACAGGRWMSSICGKEFQIWDLNEVKASFPVASLPLDLADNDSAMWIHWAYAREDVMSAVISQSSIDGTAATRHLACELRSGRSRFPTLHLCDSLQTSGPSYIQTDVPNEPHLVVSMDDSPHRLWFVESGIVIPIEYDKHTEYTYAMKKRGLFIEFSNQSQLQVLKFPLFGMQKPSSVPLQPLSTFDFSDEIYTLEATKGRLTLCDRTRTFSSQNPADPLITWIAMCVYESEVVLFHKGLYVEIAQDLDEEPRCRLETLSITTAAAFPTPKDMPIQPVLDFGSDWCLWWPVFSGEPVPEIAVYLFPDVEHGKCEGGRLLKSLPKGVMDFDERFLEFDPLSGRVICGTGNLLYVLEYV